MKRSLLPLFAALTMVYPAAAQTKVLFVGNSFTHGNFAPLLNYNAAAITDENAGQPSTSPRYEQAGSSGPWGGIPGIFKKMADEAGLNYEVHLEAISGQTLLYHYTNALPIIAQAKWNQVVMQDYSTGPLPTSHGGNRIRFYNSANLLEQAIHQQNARAQVYLYETWARADLTYPAGSTYYGLPIDSMALELHTGYYRALAANANFAAVAPAGDAWLTAINSGLAMRNPYTPVSGQLDLWNVDYYHPSKWGGYLNACVLFYQLTGRDPRLFGPTEQAAAALGISGPEAVALQQLAYQQVNTVVLATASAQSITALLTAWPNPTRTTVQVVGPMPGQPVTLCDAVGRMVAVAVMPPVGPLQLSLPSYLAPGLYVVRNQNQSCRVAIE